MPPALLLLPNVLNEEDAHELWLPQSVAQAVSSLDGLIAESEKGARRFLKRFTFPAPKTFRDIPLQLLNEHTQEIDPLLTPLLRGERWGLISDCGLPCLADPGARLVLKAQTLAIPIQAFPGPSAPILALLLSGLSGQHFTFHGYLPQEEAKRTALLKTLQTRSQLEGSTHLFIEAPYRNRKLFQALLATLHDATLLALAVDLNLPSQWVRTQPIRAWKQAPLPDIDKHPAIFLLRTHTPTT